MCMQCIEVLYFSAFNSESACLRHVGGSVPVFDAGDLNYMFTDEFLRQGGVWMKEEPVRISGDIPGLYSVK